MDPIKSPDPKEARAAMRAARQEGMVEPTAAELTQIRAKIGRVIQRVAVDTGIKDVGERPELALFSALARGPKALAAALASAEPAIIDEPLLDAARKAAGPMAGKLTYLGQMSSYTALQVCANHDLWRETRLLLAHGANANFFNAAVTAVGLAAYVGSARCLAEMRAFGCNLALWLAPEHSPNSESSHGSTLLHRVANRERQRNKNAIIRILAECEASYPDALPLTLDGKSPLDWMESEEHRELLLGVVAEREARALKNGLGEAKNAASPKIRI